MAAQFLIFLPDWIEIEGGEIQIITNKNGNWRSLINMNGILTAVLGLEFLIGHILNDPAKVRAASSLA